MCTWSQGFLVRRSALLREKHFTSFQASLLVCRIVDGSLQARAT